jgi:cytochrome c-type biogenesis protein
MVVFAINTSESRDKVERFIRGSGYTFPVLLDTDGSVMTSYGVTSIPQIFVIDPDGRIAVHLIGVRSEESLRAALATAGIE